MHEVVRRRAEPPLFERVTVCKLPESVLAMLLLVVKVSFVSIRAKPTLDPASAPAPDDPAPLLMPTLQLLSEAK